LLSSVIPYGACRMISLSRPLDGPVGAVWNPSGYNNGRLCFGAWRLDWRLVLAPIARALRRSGHEVHTPTMTGLGERLHLMNPSINLDTHITDIVNVISQEELSDVVLVGHSCGGMVITGVADQLPDKIKSLVYLDAFVPENGQSLLSLLPPPFREFPAGSDYTTAPLLVVIFAASPDVAAYVDARTTPHPTACFALPVNLTGDLDRIKKKTYIYANVPEPAAFTSFYEKLKNEQNWTVHTLPCTHLVQIDTPNELTDLLLQAVA
jgi:pimeloyl-ACP methyl ester carboxylesterase